MVSDFVQKTFTKHLFVKVNEVNEFATVHATERC